MFHKPADPGNTFLLRANVRLPTLTYPANDSGYESHGLASVLEKDFAAVEQIVASSHTDTSSRVNDAEKLYVAFMGLR